MWMLYLYATIAAAGILGLPSYGAWWQDKHNRDWWKCDPDGERHWCNEPLTPIPVAYFLGILAWPIVILGTLGYYGTKLLALPGKAFVKLSADKEQHDKFLSEAKKEVDLLCAGNDK